MSNEASHDARGFLAPLSPEEWRYASLINTHIGSLTPLLEGAPDYQSFVKALLTEAQAKGLDPKRIYRAAAILPPAIAPRMPSWHEVKPAAPSCGPFDPLVRDPGQK